jgi:hypothetical protein
MDLRELIDQWGLWPPNWYLVCGIAAVIVLSYAVHGWRELGIFIVLTALLFFPVKWLGTALGFAAFAENTLVYEFGPDRWRVGVQQPAALMATILIAALTIFAAKEVAATAAARQRIRRPLETPADCRACIDAQAPDINSGDTIHRLASA